MSTGQPDFLKTHPREALQIGLVLVALLWQTPVTLVGLVVYVLLSKVLKIEWWLILLSGMMVAGLVLCSEWFYFSHLSPRAFIHQGWMINKLFWKQVIQNDGLATLKFIYDYQVNYILGFGVLMAGLWAVMDLIPCSPHKLEMEALKKGKLSTDQDLPKALIDKKLASLENYHPLGTAVGVSKTSGQPLIIADKDLNQIGLVLGTTGGGKTITLRRFYQRAISQGYPLIIVDGKPSDENVEWIMNLAKKFGRSFHGFNCGNFHHYDPLAHGGFTELKDKIISLKDEWSSDYYRSIAEDYLQTTFELLLKSKQSYDLQVVADCLSYNHLASLTRAVDNSELKKRVSQLNEYKTEDITGLKAHINILIKSELGHYFQPGEVTFNLADIINQNAIVYFALPALKFPSFAKVLGKLVINDLKAVIDRQDKSKKIFAVFDEFSVFAGEQGLNLVNMGREKGLHSIFGTQGLAELDRVDKTFRQQLMNCVNTIICHRLNDHESAEIVATWAGTKDIFNVTAQINIKENDAAMGSVKQAKEYIIHPDYIKQTLEIGEAFYITKVQGFRSDRIKVKYS